MRIGLLGGTFDPVHIAHLVLAQEAWHQLQLDRIVFIPTYTPPHKQLDSGVSPADRLNMLRLALGGKKNFTISTYEIDRRCKSYTIDTVRHLKKELDGQLWFIAGSDAAASLDEWKDIEQLLEEVSFVIATRGGYDLEGPYSERIHHLSIPELAISSSLVRRRIREAKPVENMVPQVVLEYIRNKGLYK